MLHLPLSVSPENQAYFAENGHVYIPSLISAEELQPYRQAILEAGGSRPALDSFKAFRGREPSLDALLRHQGMVVNA